MKLRYIKYIHCHKFETKLLLITNTIYWKIETSPSSFTWRSMERNCYTYALIAVNAPILKMVYVILAITKWLMQIYASICWVNNLLWYPLSISLMVSESMCCGNLCILLNQVTFLLIRFQVTYFFFLCIDFEYILVQVFFFFFFFFFCFFNSSKLGFSVVTECGVILNFHGYEAFRCPYFPNFAGFQGLPFEERVGGHSLQSLPKRRVICRVSTKCQREGVFWTPGIFLLHCEYMRIQVDA